MCAVFVSSFRDAETVDPVSTVPRLRWASVAIPVRVAKKKTGRVIVPVPVPRVSEAYPIPRR